MQRPILANGGFELIERQARKWMTAVVKEQMFAVAVRDGPELFLFLRLKREGRQQCITVDTRRILKECCPFATLLEAVRLR
jgi:hypothetical protein